MHSDVTRTLVADIERLVEEEPLRERLWRQLVIALYRSERQADALATYRRARGLLSDTLGLDPSEELRALETAILRHEVAPAPAVEARHNLPAPVTSFVGREVELAELEQLLREHRLVTLTGMGGAGKTRMALEVATRQVGAWSGGVWLADLMPISDPALVPGAVAHTLGAAERPDVTPLAALLDRLRALELLLVLDNCEHLVEACAELADEVLRACSDVRVLATSRIALAAPGELDYALAPLATPTEDEPAGEVERFASVRLFMERGRAARRGLAADGEGLRTVGRICRELDGLPLAIELAAARAKTLSIEEIADHLDDRLRFLRSWRRVADPRHQTLRATLDWSYELLSDEERSVLAPLSVFAGGFTLQAVAAICLDGDDARALDLVGRLVESSLVVAESRQDVTRYRLLETIREYAAERLDDIGIRRATSAVRMRSTSSISRIARAPTSLGSRGTSRGHTTSFSTRSVTTCTPQSNGLWRRRASWLSRSWSPCDRIGSFGATACRASRGSRRRSRFPCKAPRVFAPTPSRRPPCSRGSPATSSEQRALPKRRSPTDAGPASPSPSRPGSTS